MPESIDALRYYEHSPCYISIDGEKKFTKELESLFELFKLLESAKTTQNFRLFLQSPLEGVDKALLILFNKLFDSYQQRVLYIKGKLLFKAVFNEVNFTADTPVLKGMLKELSQLVPKFLAWRFLQENPVELSRLKTLAIRNTNSPINEEKALQEWEKNIGNYPVSIHQVLINWQYNHISYMSTGVNKHEGTLNKFIKAFHSFEALKELVDAFYANETESWRNILQNEVSDLQYKQDSPLTSLYQQLLKVRKNGWNEESYETIKAQYLAIEPSLGINHRYFISLHVLNYLFFSYQTQNTTTLAKDTLFWVKYLYETNIIFYEPVLPDNIYYNFIQIALVNKAMDFATVMYQDLSPMLNSKSQEKTKQHALLTILFYQKEYEKALALIEVLYPKYSTSLYPDSLRIKPMRMKCLLAIFVDDWEMEEEYMQAKKDFDKFLARQKSSLADQQYSFYTAFIHHAHTIFLTKKNNQLETKRTQLISNMNASANFHAKEWLIELLLE